MPPPLNLGPPARLGYAGGGLDRAASRRSDPDALATLEQDPLAGAYVFAGDIVVLRKTGSSLDPLFTLAAARNLGQPHESAFLGFDDGAARFALALDAGLTNHIKDDSDFAASDLRSIAVRGLVAPDHLPPLAEAKALFNWHARHRFCSNCGAPTRAVEAGWRRDCPSCKAQHFPRTDPVVIMLAVAGRRCLLGRSHRFQPGMWSCLAGFIEPGETIEEAVRRETREESGIELGRVRYFASQPWPFPTSLMIGCHAEALSHEIVIDRTELDDARWFPREEVALMLARAHPEGFTAPHPFAIAYHIIRAWLENSVEFD